MSDQSVQHDLAFMRAVAEDRGPLPRTIGEHMMAPGLIFGANFLLIWALKAGYVSAPAWFDWVAWSPGAVLYLLTYPVLMARAKGTVIGPGTRAFVGIWTAVAIMTAASVALIVVATLSAHKPYFEIWPASAFILYGGAWSAMGIVRRSWRWAWVALASFLTGIGAAAVLLQPAAYLIMGAGLVICVAVPGLQIARRAAR